MPPTCPPRPVPTRSAPRVCAGCQGPSLADAAAAEPRPGPRGARSAGSVAGHRPGHHEGVGSTSSPQGESEHWGPAWGLGPAPSSPWGSRCTQLPGRGPRAHCGSGLRGTMAVWRPRPLEALLLQPPPTSSCTDRPHPGHLPSRVAIVPPGAPVGCSPTRLHRGHCDVSAYWPCPLTGVLPRGREGSGERGHPASASSHRG